MSLISKEQKNIAEDQINKLSHTMDYDTRDYPIGYIVDNFEKGDYFIPDYQREFIWLDKNRSKFIESLLLDFPIPLIFLSDTKTGQLEIVDGVQRISTLHGFINNKLVLSELEKLTSLNGFSYDDLPNAQKKRLIHKSLRIIVLRQNTTLQARKELFERLNTTAEKANPSEIRAGAFNDEFVNFITKLANDERFLTIAPVSKKRKERKEHIELVYRFFAYSDNYLNFTHGVESFVNDYIISIQNNFDEKSMMREFYQMIEFAEQYFPYGLKKTSNAQSTPRVRFEALSVGINLALRKKPSLEPDDVTKWLNSEEFSIWTTSDGSNSKTKVIGRIEYVRDKLLEGN